MIKGSDVFGQHEVVHMAHVIGNMVNEYLVAHPFIASNPELLTKARAISEALGEFYQIAGQIEEPSGTPLKPVYSIAQLAEHWGISPSTVTSEIKSGRLKAFRLGKLYRVRREAILEYERAAERLRVD